MAHKLTGLFKKNRSFPKTDHTTNDELKDLIQDIDKRLTKVETTLKELIAKEK